MRNFRLKKRSMRTGKNKVCHIFIHLSQGSQTMTTLFTCMHVNREEHNTGVDVHGYVRVGKCIEQIQTE